MKIKIGFFLIMNGIKLIKDNIFLFIYVFSYCI